MARGWKLFVEGGDGNGVGSGDDERAEGQDTLEAGREE